MSWLSSMMGSSGNGDDPYNSSDMEENPPADDSVKIGATMGALDLLRNDSAEFNAPPEGMPPICLERRVSSRRSQSLPTSSSSAPPSVTNVDDLLLAAGGPPRRKSVKREGSRNGAS